MSSTEASSGVQKVAALLLSLERDVAANVLKHLGEDVLTEVAEAMAALDDSVATPERVDELWRDLARHVHTRQKLRPTDETQLSEILKASVGPQRAATILEQMRNRRLQERPFLNIEPEAPELLARVLESESPAIAALVLVHLSPPVSAAVLSNFEAEMALDVVGRMAFLNPPGFETLQSIAGDLASRLTEIKEGPQAPDRGRRLKSIADMLNYTAEETERSVLEGLTESDEETVAEIREYMFTWEDIGSIDKRSMQKILGSVDTRTLATALKAASDEVESNVMANLSSRVREMVAEERELAGALPMSEIQASRNEIMATVRGMMDSGEFRPSRSGEDLVT